MMEDGESGVNGQLVDSIVGNTDLEDVPTPSHSMKDLFVMAHIRKLRHVMEEAAW